MMYVLAVVLPALIPFLPHPQDKDALGLRIRLGLAGPFLQHERLDRVSLDLMLINFSKEPREHDVFSVAAETGDLEFSVFGPDGKALPQIGGQYLPRSPFTVMNKLQPGDCFWDHFEGFGTFSQRLYQAGRYRIIARMKVNGKELDAPPIEFEVVEVPNDAILASHSLTRTDRKPLPGEKQERAAVEQVQLGNRVWLVYRRWGSLGGHIFARRLATLPGKCEMTVEGAYAAGNPITIKHRDANSKPEWTTLVINSISGTPWTEEDQRSLEERLKPKKDAPAPAPRVVKP